MNKKIIIITSIIIFIILVVVFTFLIIRTKRIDYAGIGAKIAGEAVTKLLNKISEFIK